MLRVQDRRVHGNPNPATAPRGGQASLGLAGFGFYKRLATSPAPAKPRGDDQSRRVGGLTFGQRRARIDAWVRFGAIAARQASATPVATKPAPVPVVPEPTAFMQACAMASDAREAFPSHYDEEAAALGSFGAAAAGSFESTLAEEGN